MQMSRGLRPISFWVNETEKLWAQPGDGREIHGKIFVFVLYSLLAPPPLSANIILLKMQYPEPLYTCPSASLMLFIYLCPCGTCYTVRVLMPGCLSDLLFPCSYKYTAPSFFLSRPLHRTFRHKCTCLQVLFMFVHISHVLDTDHCQFTSFGYK